MVNVEDGSIETIFSTHAAAEWAPEGDAIYYFDALCRRRRPRVAVGRYQGHVKATGKRIDSPLVHLWSFRNGKVVRCQEMTNTAAEAAACTACGSLVISVQK